MLINGKYLSLHYVMDKDFYSGLSVDALYAAHKKFMVGVPYTARFAKLDHTLHCCYEELLSGKRSKDHTNFYERFFIVRETPVWGSKLNLMRLAGSRTTTCRKSSTR